MDEELACIDAMAGGLAPPELSRERMLYINLSNLPIPIFKLTEAV